MTTTKADPTLGTADAALLDALQHDFPLVREPWPAIAERAGLDPDGVLDHVADLKERRLVRRISPIYDTRALGCDSALVAFRTDPERIEEVAAFVSTHPGVSHNYQRDHRMNLWFTLAIPPDARLDVEGTVDLMGLRTGVERSEIMRTVRTFKIGVRLDVRNDGGGAPAPVSVPVDDIGPMPSEREREIVRVTQDDLPLVPRPWLPAASALGMTEDEVLEALADFRERGLIRRIAAILYHRRVGFRANGMSVWNVPPSRMEEAGLAMAARPEITHCYERSAGEAWPWRLFAMIHGRTTEDVENVVREVGGDLGLYDRQILWSTREFKKRRVRHFTGDVQRWEDENVA